MGDTKFATWCHLSIHVADRPGVKCMIENNGEPNVFVVDDDPHIREALHGLIRSIQLNVYTFATTEEFLNFKRPEAPGCLVLDIRLPGLNGLDFQRSPDHLHHRTW